MAFVYSNPNPAGNLVGDCVVRGIAIAENASWEDTYMGITLEGLKLHDMPSSNAVWGMFLRNKGYTRYSIPNTCPDCYTVKDFCMDNPKGKFILATGSHVIAVINGDYYDIWDSGLELPAYYWAKEN